MPSQDREWESYAGLIIDVDSPAFTVELNSAGTRLLRSWRHEAPCSRCAEETQELYLAAVDDGAAS